MLVADLNSGTVYAAASQQRTVPVLLLSTAAHTLTRGRIEPLTSRPVAREGTRSGLPCLLLPQSIADRVAEDVGAAEMPDALEPLLRGEPLTLPRVNQVIPVELAVKAVGRLTLAVAQPRNILETWREARHAERQREEEAARRLRAQTARRDAVNATLIEVATRAGLALEIHPQDMSGKVWVDKAELAATLAALLSRGPSGESFA